MEKMSLNEFRSLLRRDETKAIEYLNNYFRNGGTTDNDFKQTLGFSWSSARPEIELLGYKKPKNRLICKGEAKGGKVLNNQNNKQWVRFTEDEILFFKELYKNKCSDVDEEIKIKTYDDYKQKSVLISETLLKELNVIYGENKVYKKQDILNEIIRLGIENFKK